MACKFFSGAETGDMSEIALNSGMTVQSTVSIHGAYTYKCTTSNDAPYLQLNSGLNLSTAYLRAYVRVHVTTNPGTNQSGANKGILNFDTAAGSDIGIIELLVTTAGALSLRARNSVASTTSGQTTIQPDTTYLLELKVVVSATVGIVEFKIDGTVAGTLSSQNTGSTNIDRAYIDYSITSGSVDVYFDDLYIDDANYPGPGKCIARQGKTGTPTYDAWTKTSSQTAAQVWSTTPFSATNNAALAGTGAGAQTMLTESFSITQSGHGTETIASGDTINACKVGLIAKVSSTSSPPTFSIRQRLNGADTDLAKVLTTGDVYYEGAIFTDTLTNLNASEIGAVRGT